MSPTHGHPAGDAAREFLMPLGKTSPSLAISGGIMAGLTLQDWVLIATLGYTLLQAGWLIYQIWRDRGRGAGQGEP